VCKYTVGGGVNILGGVCAYTWGCVPIMRYSYGSRLSLTFSIEQLPLNHSVRLLTSCLRQWIVCMIRFRHAQREAATRHRQNPGPTRPDPGLARCRVRIGPGNPVRISWTGGPTAIFIESGSPQNRVKRAPGL
jgi:hypothetical protein